MLRTDVADGVQYCAVVARPTLVHVGLFDIDVVGTVFGSCGWCSLGFVVFQSAGKCCLICFRFYSKVCSNAPNKFFCIFSFGNFFKTPFIVHHLNSSTKYLSYYYECEGKASTWEWPKEIAKEIE